MTASATYGLPACTSFDLCGVRRTAVTPPPTARCTAVLSKHLPTSLAHGACRASACPACCSKLSTRQCRLGSLCTPPARPLGSASPACSKSWAWIASSKRWGANRGRCCLGCAAACQHVDQPSAGASSGPNPPAGTGTAPRATLDTSEVDGSLLAQVALHEGEHLTPKFREELNPAGLIPVLGAYQPSLGTHVTCCRHCSAAAAAAFCCSRL